MVFVLLIFFIALVLFIWSFLLSMNFTWWDMSNLIGNFFQSEIINERNFELTSWYANFFNNNTWNNNFYCYDKNNNYEDDDCLFRSLYWFLPPGKKIDIWVFSRKWWDKILLNFTWENFSWVDMIINEVSWKRRYYYKITQENFEFDKVLSWFVYNAKLTNLGSWWIQYFLTFTWWEWIKDFSVDADWKAIISAKYNYVFWKNRLFGTNVDYKLWLTLNIDNLFGEVLTFVWFENLSDDAINQIHFNAWWNNIDWYFMSTGIFPLAQPETIYITSWMDTKSCQGNIRWYYRNPARGTSIYPLDKNTLDTLHLQSMYTGLDMVWWLYTFCSWDVQSIYGQINYIFTWWATTWENFVLQAWRSYDFTWNSVIAWDNLFPSFQIKEYNWTYIFNWIIYDSWYWVWYVWWLFSDSVVLRKLIESTNIWTNINSLVKQITDKSIFFSDSISGSALRYYKRLKY